MTLGKRIAAQRKRLGMTQEKLAERLGITAQAVSKWENDQSCPDITILPVLADLFEISTDELLGRVPVRKAEVIHDKRTNENNERTVAFTGSSVWAGILVLLTGSLLLAGRLLSWDVSLWGILWHSALLVFGISGLVSDIFRVLWDGDSAFGSIDVEGQPSPDPEGTIHIHASSNFGSVEVQYQGN